MDLPLESPRNTHRPLLWQPPPPPRPLEAIVFIVLIIVPWVNLESELPFVSCTGPCHLQQRTKVTFNNGIVKDSGVCSPLKSLKYQRAPFLLGSAPQAAPRVRQSKDLQVDPEQCIVGCILQCASKRVIF